MKRLVGIALCLQIGLLASLAGAASYSPVYVDPATGDDGNDGSEEHPFKTLDKGLEVVGASKHQALYLAPGTYQLNGNVTFADEVNQGEQYNARLIGKTGNPDDVVIDGQGLYRWHQSGQNRGICSVTFSNLYANATQALRLDKDLAVNYDDTTVRVFSNCVVKCCTAAGSELIAIFGRTAMRDCKILNCTVSGNGKSIVEAKGGAQIDDCVFADNTSSAGSIVELSNWQTMTKDKVRKSHIGGSAFLRNQASQISYFMPIVDSCLFLTNTTANAICQYPQNYSFGAPLRILNTVFDKNETTGSVGCSAIYIHNATITNSIIENCVIANGSGKNGSNAYQQYGGALHLFPKYLQGDGLTIRNVRISGMSCGTTQGSAVGIIFKSAVSGSGNLTFENCTFAENDTTKSAVYFYEKSIGRVVFKNCVFSNGTGGGVHGIKGAESSSKVSAVDLANMTNCLFASSISYYDFASEQNILNGMDPCFKAGSYVPAADSPLVDAGVNDLSWMATAYDLQRKPNGRPFRKRIYNGVVDIGAYEYWPVPGLLLKVR